MGVVLCIVLALALFGLRVYSLNLVLRGPVGRKAWEKGVTVRARPL